MPGIGNKQKTGIPMNHEIIITLTRVFSYFTILVWILLGLLLLLNIFRKKWNAVKRVSKYLVNSIVFIIVFSFNLELALIVRAPVDKEHLQGWINKQVQSDIYISLNAVLVLLLINYFFYKKVDQDRHKYDLFFLALFDILVLLTGAWLSGQNAYFGLLEEINRNHK
jgi:hypothetical protein